MNSPRAKPSTRSCGDPARRRLAIPLAAALFVTSGLIALGQPTAWPDTYGSRVEILALMQTLNADILANESATLSLEKWCRDHKMANEPRITARLVRDVNKPPTAEQMQRLQVAGAAELKYRRVELGCGDHLLSEADNWYVPARLTAEMNRLLDTTDTPFGRVVQALRPDRRTFFAALLWSPLPAGWALKPPSPPASPAALAIPKDLIEHRAVLFGSDNRPFSEVAETYQRSILDFRRD